MSGSVIVRQPRRHYGARIHATFIATIPGVVTDLLNRAGDAVPPPDKPRPAKASAALRPGRNGSFT